jgi:hypothetical protein
MNMPLPVHKTLFDHEVLRARLEIRDFFLRNLFREVYENIGQMLSLVRFNLAGANPRAEAASELVAQVIRDLRQLCKNFYPDADLLKEGGLKNGLKEIVDIIFPGSQHLVQIKQAADEMQPGLKLIVFNMLLEVLITVAEFKGDLTGINIIFLPASFEFSVNYTGAGIQVIQNNKLSLAQRADLINGKLDQSIDNAGTRQIKLFSL